MYTSVWFLLYTLIFDPSSLWLQRSRARDQERERERESRKSRLESEWRER